jgi:hypothetical protein
VSPLCTATTQPQPPLYIQTRLAHPAGANATPVEVRRSGLRSMRRMLPRMHLAGRASAIMHPLVRVLDGPAEELRREASPKQLFKFSHPYLKSPPSQCAGWPRQGPVP